ncbi:MAG: response regulator transcription factor [Bacteroidota bacterium]|nr:response regulator transcription factor [Bacteroidota bacterium]MDP4215960.1 response regulator transcription factor [Bacteroidota bacterium]MDP4246765.1 response regulator transcription factor [Bacteroidota bacterium]MDP4253793.1 response regulator transcription factor [Bacteroidota bacterium]MDP4259603.1 response regulator transcription factor [Bacteroidota bacterium]
MRILLADDHAVVRRTLRLIITEEIMTANIVEVADADELMDRVMHEPWDLVISDISMPGSSGLEVLQQIRRNFPNLPVLILSASPKEQYAARVLKAGASGYLNKEAAGDELVNAIHCILSGNKYI